MAMIFKGMPTMVCKCGHNLKLVPDARAVDNGVDTYNFIAKCGNLKICSTPSWIISLKAVPGVAEDED